MRSARIHKASQVYFLLLKAEPDEELFLMYHSAYKPVQERLRNYFQKYIPAVQEISAEEWAEAESKAGPRRSGEKVREEFVAHRLDHRPRKPAPPPVPVPPVAVETAPEAGRRVR